MPETFLILATVFLVVGLPVTGLIGLLLMVGGLERAREARIARQVALTDAIHRELGALVAPVVEHRVGRGWRVVIAVPFERPALVGRIVAIAQAAMRRGGVSTFEIALTAQPPPPRQIVTRERLRATVAPLTVNGR